MKTCHSSRAPAHLDEGKDTRRDFALACTIAMSATTACSVLPDRWFPPPHFRVHTDFSVTSWDATVEIARVHPPIWPACWVQCSDRSRRTSSEAVQNIWDVRIQELSSVPVDVRERSRTARNTEHVGAFRQIWSRRLKASLVRAYHTAGILVLLDQAVHREESTVSAHCALGGRCKDRIYRTDHADGFDATNSGFFINSSLCPEKHQDSWVIDAWMSALWYRWAAVTKRGPIGPIPSFEPWTHWILSDWAKDALSFLNEFVLR